MQTFPTPIHEILTRVERRELQVDVAAARIFDIFGAGRFARDPEVQDETPEDAIGQAVQGTPVGTLTTYGAMDHNRRDNGEGEDLVDILEDAGYKTVEGADAVLDAIKSIDDEEPIDTLDTVIDNATTEEVDLDDA